MINAIPFIGWILSVAIAISMAIPFWFFWKVQGVGAKFFYFLPELYTKMGFWDTVMLFIVVSILKSILFPHFGGSTVNNSGK